MESEQDAVTFVLKVDENGRHIYTLQPTGEQYELDEETQEMIEIQDPVVEMLHKRIKLELPDTDDSLEAEGAVITEMEEELEEEEVEQDAPSPEGSATDNQNGSHAGSTSPTKVKLKRLNMGSLEGIITQHMDIQAPLSTLKTLLERRFSVKLTDYDFWLQDKQMLEAHRTLVEQCVQGEGLVQVNLQVKCIGDSKRINIEDVLKPAEEYPESLEDTLQLDEEPAQSTTTTAAEDPPGAIVRWIVDNQFKKEAERLKIPPDPFDWTVAHVRHWLQWAVRQFNLAGLRLSDWQLTGRELCQLSLTDFKTKVKKDTGDLFWTHLELLRKCKFVAVVQKSDATKIFHPGSAIPKNRGARAQKNIKMTNKLTRVIGLPIATDATNTVNFSPQVGNRTGNNGQVQLWQFLLELLTDKEHRHVIQWIGNEGEFKLINPEIVAQLWGERKNKPTMNYEKLSRALRYYYDGDMISKVHGKRFVYKYVCDLKQLIGYSPNELNRLCAEAAGQNNILIPLEDLNYEECC